MSIFDDDVMKYTDIIAFNGGLAKDVGLESAVIYSYLTPQFDFESNDGWLLINYNEINERMPYINYESVIKSINILAKEDYYIKGYEFVNDRNELVCFYSNK